MALLKIENIEKTYVAGSITTAALRGVTLTVEEGEFTAVVGPSGSGKTTLINLIGGLDRPDGGSISLRERVLTGLSQRELSDIRLRHIGFVFQAYNLIPVLTALENVEYVMLLQGVPRGERTRRALAMLDEVGLKTLAKKRPSEMSGGQQQRVAVARAIVSEPSLVLADEPTANLDSHTAGLLLDLMKEMNEKKGITFLFSTHDPLVMERARRVVHIHDGAVVDG